MSGNCRANQFQGPELFRLQQDGSGVLHSTMVPCIWLGHCDQADRVRLLQAVSTLSVVFDPGLA